MPNGIESSYSGADNRALRNAQRTDQVREQNQVERRQTENLQSEATSNEQRSRDRAAQNNGLLAENNATQTLNSPSSQTLQELDRRQASSQNEQASPRGQAALNSYQSLESDNQRQALSQQVKVDISV